MKRTKLMASLLAVLMLMMALTTTMVSAEEITPTAKVTIKNDPSSTATSISGVSFALYKVFDVTVIEATDIESESIEYTIDEDFMGFFEDDDVLGEYTGTDDNELAIYTNEALEYINSFKTYDDNGELLTNTMADLVVLLMEYIETNGTAYETATGTSPTIVSEVEYIQSEAVDYGYYLIVDTDTTAAEGGIVPAGSLVTVPGTASDGTFSADVTIDMKGSMPEINKEVWHNDITNSSNDVSPTYGTTGSWDEVADYQIGDIIEYRITATVPTDLRGYTEDYTYIVTDTLSDGLEFIDGSLGIYTSANLDSSTNMVSSGLHSITYNDGYIFQIDFDMYDISQTDAFEGLTTFYIYYQARVTAAAEVANDYESNVVSLEYSNNPYDLYSTGEIEDTVYSYTFDLDILKTAGDGMTPLADAKFALYEVTYENDSQVLTQIYLTLDTDTEDLENLSQTYFPDNGTATSENGIIETNDSGEFDIIGLDDATTYMLKEISAPDGYNIADPVTFVIYAEYDDASGVPTPTLSTSEGSFSLSESGLYGTIVNTSNQLLPSTGGIGTTIFYVAGGAVMLAAIVIYIVNRKKTTVKYK
ncbi:MAG: SpaH/EbpB family LPXTG-anchored major pilin [Clostridia bacterium]